MDTAEKVPKNVRNSIPETSFILRTFPQYDVTRLCDMYILLHHKITLVFTQDTGNSFFYSVVNDVVQNLSDYG